MDLVTFVLCAIKNKKQKEDLAAEKEVLHWVFEKGHYPSTVDEVGERGGCCAC